MSTEKKITSYEDACKALNIKPINEEVFNAFPKEDRKSMIAYHKLTVIVRALNNGWLPDLLFFACACRIRRRPLRRLVS